jgi:hypothetical protein
VTKFTRQPMPIIVGLSCFLAFAACNPVELVPGPGAVSTAPTPPITAVPTTRELARVEQVIDAADQVAATINTIRGMGYATVSSQPGTNLNQRRLNAIRVARIEAMRDLTEQIHGVRIDASTTIAESVLQNDTLQSTVVGMLRAARTVHIQPRGSDTYEVLLEIDRDMIDQMLKIARRGA